MGLLFQFVFFLTALQLLFPLLAHKKFSSAMKAHPLICPCIFSLFLCCPEHPHYMVEVSHWGIFWVLLWRLLLCCSSEFKSWFPLGSNHSFMERCSIWIDFPTILIIFNLRTGTENFLVHPVGSHDSSNEGNQTPRKELIIAPGNLNKSRSHKRYIGSLNEELNFLRLIFGVKTHKNYMNSAAGPNEGSHNSYEK